MRGAFLISFFLFVFFIIDQAENQPTRLHPSVISCKQRMLHYSSPPDRWDGAVINSLESLDESVFKLVPQLNITWNYRTCSLLGAIDDLLTRLSEVI